jgi:hypothetical protein
MDMLMHGEIVLIDEIAAIFNNKTELTNLSSTGAWFFYI